MITGPASGLGTWVLAGGTALGTTHAESGLPCQDSIATWVRPPGGTGRVVAVAAVADGAGSARLSHIGSQTAVAEVVRMAQALGTDPAAPAAGPELVRALFTGARRAVEGAAPAAGALRDDLATTLIVAVVTEDGFAVAEVGDGVVAVRTSGGIVGPLAPQRGEFANETTFITTGGTLPELASASFPAGEVTAFGLSSDGMRLLITAHATDGSPHVPFFEDVFGGVVSGLGSEALAHFLEAADDRTGDDKSLVIGVLLP
ncbi:MAG TPA: PP2C family serine/threonine-protein phosphatase [Actinomycetota bacterium]|nr:PP2C family serine/threonine-protein phosphatase [Actinomycetota bacterium]